MTWDVCRGFCKNTMWGTLPKMHCRNMIRFIKQRLVPSFILRIAESQTLKECCFSKLSQEDLLMNRWISSLTSQSLLAMEVEICSGLISSKSQSKRISILKAVSLCYSKYPTLVITLVPITQTSCVRKWLCFSKGHFHTCLNLNPEPNVVEYYK